MQISCGEQFISLVFVAGCHDDHVRNAPQVAEIKTAGMGRAVFPHQSRPINREQHIKILQGHVMNQLIISSLQESGINGYYRLGFLACQARRKSDRVLFRYGNIVEAIGVIFGELLHA